MLNNKKVNVVLSIIIAVCMWAYVIGETDPKDTETFRNVPITFVNEGTLDLSDLAILDTSTNILDVTVTGTRVKLSNAELKDITATVDLSDAALGSNELKINVKAPDGLEIEDQSVNKVTINIEHKAVKDADITVAYDGQFESNQEPLIVEMGKTVVSVSGAESKVRTVSGVRAMVKAEDVEEHLKTVTCALVPVDEDGIEVTNVKLSADYVKLTTVLVSTKTVPLEVPVIDDSEDDILRHASVPKTITIKGKVKELNNIEKIVSEPVDITGITENVSLPIEIVLPEDVQVSDKSYQMNAKVTVEKLGEKEFTFSEKDIELLNLPEDLKAEISEGEITINCKGKSALLDELGKDDFKLSIDLKDAEEGEISATIKAECKKDITSFKVSPEEVNVKIEKQ